MFLVCPTGNFFKHSSGHFHKVMESTPLRKRRYRQVAVMESTDPTVLNLRDSMWGKIIHLPKTGAEKVLFSNPTYADREVELKVPRFKGRTHAKIEGGADSSRKRR